MARTQIGVFFGGQSPEHEVSVITGLQAAAALSTQGNSVVPVYISKAGRWYVGDQLKDIKAFGDVPKLLSQCAEITLAPGPGRSLALIPRHRGRFKTNREIVLDVAFLAFHGSSGENGSVQGLCETMTVPYTGSGVAASALGMNKVLSKKACLFVGVPVVDWVEVSESSFRNKEEAELTRIETSLGFPAIVKPISLGSSIGIARVENRAELDAAIEEALRYDAHVLVEKCVPNLREINASVLGDGVDSRVSVLEEPLGTEGVLSFKDKYMNDSSGGKTSSSKSMGEGMASLGRVIPAPVTEDEAVLIREMALKVFAALDCSGVVRIDFLMDAITGEVWFNEINTIPGSLSFYLWEPTGVPFDSLVQTLVDLAIHRFEERTRRVRSYDVNLLAERSAKGLKGSKS